MSKAFTLEDIPPSRRAQVEAQLGGFRPAIIPPTGDIPADARYVSRLEKDEQKAVMDVLRKANCVVYNLSQPRASKQTAGLPDLWWTCPLREISGWFETKRGKGPGQRAGKLTQEQLEFRDECAATGIPFGTGDRHAAAAFVRDVILQGNR